MTTISINRNATVGEIMAAMRPHVEAILQRYAAELPTAPSQSHRAHRFMDDFAERWTEACAADRQTDTQANLFQLIRDRDALRDFLAVHRAACISEWIERNGSFEF